jgi:hypothetical protein
MNFEESPKKYAYHVAHDKRYPPALDRLSKFLRIIFKAIKSLFE